MADAPVVVTPRSLRRFGNEAQSGDIKEAVESTTEDPAEQAALMGALGDAMQAIDVAGEEDGDDVMSVPRNANGSLLLSAIAEYVASTGKVDALDTGGLEAKFDPTDITGWLGSFWHMVKLRLGGKHGWSPPPVTPDTIGDHARLAILSDWGTAMYGAPVSAATIAREGGFTHLVHLGDVYYSGTEKEVRDRFLSLWPQVPGAVSRACNSNHEMYSSGKAYFTMTLPAFQQSSSCFAFQNRHWILVGLDTGYDDHDLAHNQADWVRSLVAAAGERKVVLLSHHQPLSRFDRQGPKLVTKLGEVLTSGRIFAWYWGHEHRCAIYDAHPSWGLHGRCIGHGGIPAGRGKVQSFPLTHGPNGSEWRSAHATPTVPGCVALDGPNIYTGTDRHRFGPHGYATIELDGPHLLERMHTPTGEVIYEKQLA